MKIIARRQFFLLFFIIPIFCISQEKKLNGNVKSTREKVIFVNDSIQNYKFLTDDDYGHSGFTSPKNAINQFSGSWYNEIQVRYINNKRNYNKKGLLKKEFWFLKNNKKFATYEYDYTDFDSIKKIVGNNYLKQITNFTYNYENRLESALTLNEDESDPTFIAKFYSYKKSKLIKLAFFTNEGNSINVFFTYNKMGLENKKIIHTPKIYEKTESNSYTLKEDSLGQFYTKSQKFYDLEGNLIQEESFTHPNIYNQTFLRNKLLYKYDNRGNCIEKKEIQSDSSYVSAVRKRYDLKSRKIYESWIRLSPEQFLEYSKEYFYNDNDELTQLIINRENKTYKVNFTYKYDKQNNWIEQTKYIDGKKLFIWKRQITYY
jgi:hypothetical protein